MRKFAIVEIFKEKPHITISGANWKELAELTEEEIKKLLTNIDECQTYPELYNKLKKVLEVKK